MTMRMLPSAPLLDLISFRYPEITNRDCNKNDADKSAWIFESIGLNRRTFFRAKSRGTLREDIVDIVCCNMGVHPYLIYGELWFVEDDALAVTNDQTPTGVVLYSVKEMEALAAGLAGL